MTWGWIKTNPAAGAAPPRVPATSIAPPSPTDLARLVRVTQQQDPDLAAYITLAAATGARRSEVIALRWSNLDLDRSVLTIARGLVVGPDGVVEKGTKTHSIRRIALDAGTVSVLRQHRERAETAASKAGLRVGDGAFVFTRTPDGETPWFPDSVSRAFRRQCELVGIDNARLHDLRHYVATRLLGSGVDVRTVAGRLGHGTQPRRSTSTPTSSKPAIARLRTSSPDSCRKRSRLRPSDQRSPSTVVSASSTPHCSSGSR